MFAVGRLKSLLPVFAASVAFGSLLTACGSSSGSSGQSVTLAKTSENGLQLILVDIANQEGLFAKHGVRVKVVALHGDAASIPALTSGSVQFAVSTSTPFFAAAKKSKKIQVIAPISAEPPAQVVMGKAAAARLGITQQMPVPKRMQTLRQKHIAVLDVGGGLQYTLNAALSVNGVNPNDVHVSGISPYPAMLAALRRGAIDAAAPAVPYGYQAVAEGDGVMLADIWSGEVPSIRNLYFELVDVNRDYATAHPQTVRNVRAALADAMTFIRSNPQGALAVAKKLPPSFSDDVLRKSITGPGQFPSSTDITQQDFQTLANFASQSGVDPAGVTYGDSVWKG